MKPLQLLAAMILFAAAPAFAQSWYAGIAAGAARGEVDSGRIDADLRSLGFLSSSTTGDTSDTTWRIFAGFKVLPWLDLEAYYADLGKTNWASAVSPPGTLSARIESKAYGLAAIASLSPVERLRLFAKLGVASTDADASFSASGFVELAQGSTSKRQTSAVYGVGAQYAITPRVSVRAEYDVHDKVGSDEMGGRFRVQSATLGVVFPF
jgi:OmpA-OmpF porin, OOP family